jgi:hypothetical protein
LPKQPEASTELNDSLNGLRQDKKVIDTIELIQNLLASGASTKDILAHLSPPTSVSEDAVSAKLQAAGDTTISNALHPMAVDIGPKQPVHALPSTVDRLSAPLRQECGSSNPLEGAPFSPKLAPLAEDQVKRRASLAGRRQQLLALCLATAVVGGGATGTILLQRAPAGDLGGSTVVAVEAPERSFAPITPAQGTNFRHSEVVFPAAVEAAANSSGPSLAAPRLARERTPVPAGTPRQRPSGVTPQMPDRGATNSQRTHEPYSSDRVANRLNGEERRRHALRSYPTTTYSRPPAYRQRASAPPLRWQPPGRGYSPYYAGWVAPGWARRLPY